MSRFPLRPEPVGAEIVALKEPPDWDAVFGRSGPLELEIGSGTGLFALGYAKKFPSHRYLAFEWRKKFAREAQFRSEQAGLKNLKFVEADARVIVPRIFK